MHFTNDDSFFRSRKLIKSLSDPLIFTDGKNSSINQYLSKMQGKFEIN